MASSHLTAASNRSSCEQRHHHIWQPFEAEAVAAVRKGRQREPRIYLNVPQTARVAATEPSAGDREQRRHHIWESLVAEAVEAVRKGRERDIRIYLKVPRLGRAARRPQPQRRHLRAERLTVVQKVVPKAVQSSGCVGSG
jgi:hypothetical protein